MQGVPRCGGSGHTELCWVVLAACAGLLCVLAHPLAASAQTMTVEGSLHFDDPVRVERWPVDHVAIRVMNWNEFSDDILWEGLTDEYGRFSAVMMPDQWDRDPDGTGPDIYLEFETDTEIVKIQRAEIQAREYSWLTDRDGPDRMRSRHLRPG